jgi:glycosyltransferase involved in cell wall biosynthesis
LGDKIKVAVVGTAEPVQTPRLKVGVVVPSGDTVHSRFMVSLVSLFQYSERKGLELVIINPRSSLIGTGRQIGVDMALQKKVDYILWLDSDMTFPYLLLEELLKTGKDVVGCTYVKRFLPTSLNHKELEGEAYVGEGVREVARLPTGALLVKASVFDGMEKPYFRCSYPGDGTEVGEDYWFCDTVRAAGGTIWLHAGLSKYIGHLGIYSHTLGDLDL